MSDREPKATTTPGGLATDWPAPVQSVERGLLAASGHRPIHVPSQPTTPHGSGGPEPMPKNCEACGAWHGGVNARIHCLESSVRGLRRDLKAALEQRDELRDERNALRLAQLAKKRLGPGE